MSLKKRLLQEIKELAKSEMDNITAGPISEDNLLHWNATIIGPEDSPYAGGIFILLISF